MKTLEGKVIFITGASRGIGRAIALRCAQEGAKLVLAAKSVTEGKLPGTIYSVAQEIKDQGGDALALPLDVRDESQVEATLQSAVDHFGRFDVLINNAGAIMLTPLSETAPKRMDLMLDINVRAVLVCSHYAIPHLVQSGGGHILNLSPPISAEKHWLSDYVTYTISKYGMSLATVGMSGELKDKNISVNSLWPKTIIATAAINWLMGEQGMEASRTPEIMADAAYEILKSGPELTGQWLLDEPFLRSRGYTDFEKYNASAAEPMPDLFVEKDSIVFG